MIRDGGLPITLNVSPLTPIICRSTPLGVHACNPNWVVLHVATNVRHLCDFKDAMLTWWGKKAVLLPIDNRPYVRESCFDFRREHLAHSLSCPCHRRIRVYMSEVLLPLA